MTTYTVIAKRQYEITIEVPDDSHESLELFVNAAETFSRSLNHSFMDSHDAGDAVGVMIQATNNSPDGTFAYVDPDRGVSATGTYADEFFQWSPKPPRLYGEGEPPDGVDFFPPDSPDGPQED